MKASSARPRPRRTIVQVLSFSLIVTGCGRTATETKPVATPASASTETAPSSTSASIPGLQPPSADCPDMGDGNAIGAYDWAARYQVAKSDVEVMRALPTMDRALKASFAAVDRPLFDACATLVKELGGASGAMGTHDVCLAAVKALSTAKTTLGLSAGGIVLDIKKPTCTLGPAPSDCASACSGDAATCNATCEVRRLPLVTCTGASVHATVKSGDAAQAAKLLHAIEATLPALLDREAAHADRMKLVGPTIEVLRGIDSRLGAIPLADDVRAKLGQCVAPLEQHLQGYFGEWGDGDAVAKAVRDAI